MFQPDENNPMLIKGYEMRILTTTEEPQVCKRQQSFTHQQKAFLSVKTPRLIKNKIVEDSESPYRSPILLVEYIDRIRAFMSKHGDNATKAMQDPACADMIAGFYRLCVDLRLVNQVTVSDAHPMPKVIDVLNEFEGCSHFSAFDVTDAFWSVCLAIQDRHKTAFATHDMLLQWRVMPQGSKNGATVFSRIIQQTFQGCSSFISKYQDDIFNHTKTIRELLSAHQETLDRLVAKNMTVAIKKSRMNYPRIKALGQMITERGRCPDIKQIQAIINICTPECTQDVQHVIGLCNFSRDYIPNLAAEADVLMELIPESVDVTAEWRDSIHGRALRRIKALLTSAPYLQLPDPNRPYRIHVDGCLKHRGKGAVLLQQSRLWTAP